MFIEAELTVRYPLTSGVGISLTAVVHHPTPPFKITEIYSVNKKHIYCKFTFACFKWLAYKLVDYPTAESN